MSTAETRILHIHIEKTGGTALRMALQRALGPTASRFPRHHENQPAIDLVPDQWDLISGHFGYAKLAPLGGRLVVLLRDPVDRFMSVYYYWREMHARGGTATTRQTELAAAYSLDDFAGIWDEPPMTEQFFNRMTWQLAETFILPGRQRLRSQGIRDPDLLALAIRNMRHCHVVGVQENMPAFAQRFHQRLGLALKIEAVNVTAERARVADLAPSTRRKIMDWVYLDVELYQAACALAAARAHYTNPL